MKTSHTVQVVKNITAFDDWYTKVDQGENESPYLGVEEGYD